MSFVFVSEIAFTFLLSLWITAVRSAYRVGIGIADVTGPPSGVTFVRKHFLFTILITAVVTAIDHCRIAMSDGHVTFFIAESNA